MLERYITDKQDSIQFKSERNVVVKLIKMKNKEYYENMIDSNCSDPAMMLKPLKKLIRGKHMNREEINIVDFEIFKNIGEPNLGDKFNLYYIQSIDEI